MKFGRVRYILGGIFQVLDVNDSEIIGFLVGGRVGDGFVGGWLGK